MSRFPWAILLVGLATAIACGQTGAQHDLAGTPDVPADEPGPGDPLPDTDTPPDDAAPNEDLPGEDVPARGCGGWLGQTCSETEYCDYQPDDMCGAADASSVCRTRPTTCTKEQIPVCGCDGTIYANACLAHQAGTGLNRLSSCEGEPCGDRAKYAACNSGLEEGPCHAAGGWIATGPFGEVFCECPTGDGGCPCRAGSDCAYLCLADADPCEGQAGGTCSDTNAVFGCVCVIDFDGIPGPNLVCFD